ncbi:MAG: hypothetical protein JXQ89_05145 [Pelagimonas sp.]
MRHMVWLALAAGPGMVCAETLDPVDQAYLNSLIDTQGMAAAFDFAFEAGDELTEHSFDAASGVGAHVGEGRRFTRFPRADLNGPGEWATHVPKREGGANATSCIACHNAPEANGAGDVALNAVIDPNHTGDPSKFLERNTLHLFALGIPQRIAEEMSGELYRHRDALRTLSCGAGQGQIDLMAKGIEFGTLSATRTQKAPCKVSFDTSLVTGVDPDLVIKPFGWKGNHATIRAFTRGAAHNELGLQAVELVGDQDGDYDGVTHELTVGDMTALTIYMAALERPTSLLELAAQGVIDLDDAHRAEITMGERRMAEVGCTSCHQPKLPIADPVFSEPSQTEGFHDVIFPDGSSPAEHAMTTAVTFDLTRDQPNNRLEGAHLGAVPMVDGVAQAEWYSDFRRHDMGEALADPEGSQGIERRHWLTRSLAGVGSTGPWLHDGRATTLHEAIVAHGGAALSSRDAYQALPDAHQAEIVAFLENLVIHKTDEDEDH